LSAVDVSNPAAPVVLGSLTTGFDLSDVAVSGEYAFAVSRQGLRVIDVSNPTAPVLTRLLVTPGEAEEISIAGSFAYVTDHRDGIKIFDISDPPSTYFVGSVDVPGQAMGVALTEPYVYVATDEPATLSVAQVACEPPIEISIDVKPGSVNCKKRNGVVPVAVLTTDEFEAAWIDHTTVTFGPGEAREAHQTRHGIARHEQDVDGNPGLDLMFHFRFDETGIECGDDSVSLEGYTYDGRKVIGRAVLHTVPGGD